MTKDELRTTLATLVKTLPKVQRLCEWAQGQDLILELLALILSRSEADKPMPSQFELLALFVMRMSPEHREMWLKDNQTKVPMKSKGKVKHEKDVIVNFSYQLDRKPTKRRRRRS